MIKITVQPIARLTILFVSCALPLLWASIGSAATGAVAVDTDAYGAPTALNTRSPSRSVASTGAIANHERKSPAQTHTSMRLAQSAAAAGVDPKTPAPATLLQQVVVTAEKRMEPIQDVPMSIVAVTPSELQNSGAMTLQDIGHMVPGLSIVAVSPGQNQIILRGVSSSAASAPTVGFYIDDTPIPAMGIFHFVDDPVLFDLARVEVLKGPQGTLYGASSMGGTVRYIMSQPQLGAFTAAVQEMPSYTDGGGVNNALDAMANVPLSSSVAIRASAVYQDYSGYINRAQINPTNIIEAASGSPVTKDVNTDSTTSVRFALKYQPSQSLTITPWVMYQRMSLGAPFTFDDPPASFDHPIQLRDTSEPSTNEFTLAALPINAEVGRIHLASVTSYYDTFFQLVEDDSKADYYFFSPTPQTYVYPSPYWNSFHNKTLTEEMRASGTFGRVRGLLGLYYTHSNNTTDFWWPIPGGYNTAFGTPFGSTQFFFGNQDEIAREEAVFGQFDVHVIGGLHLILGDRVSWIRESDSSAFNGVYNGGPSGGPQVYSVRQYATTPKLELSYHITRNAMLYGSAAKGFRPGNTQGTVPVSLCGADLHALGLSASPSSYFPDSIWEYEIGDKFTSQASGLMIDSDVFDIKWSHLQQLILLPTCGFDFTGNFGTARSKGAELQVTHAIGRALTVSLSGTFTQAQLTSSVTGAQGVAGNPLENVPKWMGGLSLDYHTSIRTDISGFAHLDMNMTSRQYNNFVPTSIYYATAGYSLVDARVGIDTAKNWEVALYVTDLLDKRAETALPNSYGINLPTFRMVSLNQPRTIGVQIRRDF